jgi:hypothetical protein
MTVIAKGRMVHTGAQMVDSVLRKPAIISKNWHWFLAFFHLGDRLDGMNLPGLSEHNYFCVVRPKALQVRRRIQ